MLLIKCARLGITDSKEYLKKALEDLEAKIVHVSISIEAKYPKFSPKIEEMRKSISDILKIQANQVGITATTGEGLTAFRKRRRYCSNMYFDCGGLNMKLIYKKARAKINLTLNVVNKREDGYHNIESVFQKIGLYDELYIKKGTKETGITVHSNVIQISGEANIIYKAYQELKVRFPQITEVNVVLKKKIPMQARTWGWKCRLC